MTQKRPRNPRGGGERLRQEIIDAAAALIAEEGQEGLSLRAIARRAGVTAPAIYSHFDDLDGVRRAVITSTFADFATYLRRKVRGHKNPEDRLRALCRAYIAFGRKRPREYAVMFGPAADPRASRAQKSIETMPGGEAFSVLLDAIRACVDSGASQSTHPVDDATAVWVALHGYVGLRMALPDFPWPQDDTLLNDLIDRLARLK